MATATEIPRRLRGRLTQPLIRSNGTHHPATWDEALDLVSRRFQEQVQTHGPRTFGMFSCSKTTNELNYTAQKFVRSVIGCNNIDSCNRT
jgi:formate dehydrogenase major subunit